MAISDHGDSDLKQHYLLQAYALKPNDLLVNYHLLLLCVQLPNSGLCGLPFVDTLLALDGENLATLISVALYYADLGDYSQALHYLDLAAKGTLPEDYVLRHLRAMDASFQRQGIARSFQSLAEYFEVAVASSITDYRKLVQLCDLSQASAKTQQLCAAVGTQLQHHSKSALDQLVGGAVNLRYGNLAPAEYNLQSLQQQAKASRDQQALEGLEELFENSAQLQLDNHQWQEYLALYKNAGEVTATEFLKGYAYQVQAHQVRALQEQASAGGTNLVLSLRQ